MELKSVLNLNLNLWIGNKNNKNPSMMAVAYGLRAELMSALMKASSQRSLLSATLYRTDTQPSSEEKTSRFALKNIFSSAQLFKWSIAQRCFYGFLLPRTSNPCRSERSVFVKKRRFHREKIGNKCA